MEPMNAPVSETLPKSHAHWSAHEAFLGILTLVAVWDGHKATSRLRGVRAFAERSPFLSALGEKRQIQLQSDVVMRMGECEGEALDQVCAILPPEMHASMYAACADILGAAGVFSKDDRALLDQLRTLLGIEPQQAEEIEAVLLLKNRF